MPCGIDCRAGAVSSEHAVVIMVHTHYYHQMRTTRLMGIREVRVPD